ncbi:hypothetical protein BDP27DRAFT_1427791 [Rhodocollybia butyracea]|uniref:CxC2-like cysteine cluster KDZ transposase-associated domain-containing protein n=1 Tax=Rhodocollybia butyracea TaxID=206335 RepID=A0A9P5U2F2_9AGAR|nr:hypothetical protein BDP27DRAFT_1427791 [Rhodocollybia butyracea]
MGANTTLSLSFPRKTVVWTPSPLFSATGSWLPLGVVALSVYLGIRLSTRKSCTVLTVHVFSAMLARNMGKGGRKKLDTIPKKVTKMGRIRALESDWGTTVYDSASSMQYVSYSSDGKHSVVPFPSSSSKHPLPPSPEPPKKTTRRKRVYKPQGASVYMQSFDEFKVDIKDAIFATDSSTLLNFACSCGADNAICNTRCMDCAFLIPLAPPVSLPIIYVDISELGHVITLGHNGQQCPSISYDNSSQWISMIIMDLNGVHSTKIAFCHCGTIDRMRQLLAHRYFPSTTIAPRTAFTFACLEDFQTHSLNSKISAHDYVWSKQEQTNPLNPQSVPNLRKAFVRVSRQWRLHQNLKSSGQHLGIDKYIPFRTPGNTMHMCLTCPTPGFNMPVEDWDPNNEDPNREFLAGSHLSTVFISQDGHFGLTRKDKIDDKDDIGLLDGQGLFPVEEEYQRKSTCSKFNAIEMQNKLKFKGSVITGVVGGMCARHSVFLAMVDLQHGERYINADYTLSMMLVELKHSIRLAKYIQRVVLTYDIACQYCQNLHDRFDKAPFNKLDIGDIMDMIVLLMGKALSGPGQRPKEWVAARTYQEMNHGHRHEVLTSWFNKWNFSKMLSMPESLYTHLKRAIPARDAKVTEFLDASVAAGQRNVASWENESTEVSLDAQGEWTSVYRFRESKMATQETILNTLLQHSDNRATAKQDSLEGALPIFVNRAMKIEWEQRSLACKLAGSEISMKAANQERTQLRNTISLFRETQLVICPALGDVLAVLPYCNLEVESLLLPSHFELDRRTKCNLLELGNVEAALRKGQAQDAILDLCKSIKALHMCIQTKVRNKGSQKRNTRSSRFVRQMRQVREGCASTYRYARTCLIKLGKIDQHSLQFPQLNDEDMYIRNIREDAALGEGSTFSGWIWNSRLDPELEEGRGKQAEFEIEGM